MTTPVLEGEGLTKTFGSLVAVDDVDFALADREILGLIGPNGSGKTTLTNLITGELAADAGTVRMNGEEITGLPQNQICKRGLIKTHQVARPIENMTVAENVIVAALFGHDASVSPREAAAEAERWLEFVDLTGFADARPRSLTHTTLRRLELARALATRPRVILLDEVAAGLTKDEIELFMDLIGRIRDDLDVTILWIEHIVEAVMTVTDRIMVLNNGAKIAEGTPAEIAADSQVQEAYLGGSG